jgi:hypothetical protein
MILSEEIYTASALEAVSSLSHNLSAVDVEPLPSKMRFARTRQTYEKAAENQSGDYNENNCPLDLLDSVFGTPIYDEAIDPMFDNYYMCIAKLYMGISPSFSRIDIKYFKGYRYYGESYCGMPQGRGVLYALKGNRRETFYEGNWEKGKFSGEGVLTYKSGNKYYGRFSRGKRNGFGYIKAPDGSTLKIGKWKNNILVKSERRETPASTNQEEDLPKHKSHANQEEHSPKHKSHRIGLKKYPYGQVYEGHFVGGLREGIGRLFFKITLPTYTAKFIQNGGKWMEYMIPTGKKSVKKTLFWGAWKNDQPLITHKYNEFPIFKPSKLRNVGYPNEKLSLASNHSLSDDTSSTSLDSSDEIDTL